MKNKLVVSSVNKKGRTVTFSTVIPDYLRGRKFTVNEIDGVVSALFVGFHGEGNPLTQMLSNFTDEIIEQEYFRRTPLGRALDE